MDKPVDNYWRKRVEETKEALEANNFEVYLAETAAEAKDIVLNTILPAAGAKSIGWGGSMTFVATGLYDALKNADGTEIFDPGKPGASMEEAMEIRRNALMTDLFITGTNALTESGKLVNLDMIGNRVAALTFGPRSVVVLVGRNKIVPDVAEGMFRIKDFAAPANAMRLDKKTPCVKTSFCEDCKSPGRICNTWTITEKCFPPKRIKVVLINEELGF